MHKTEPWRYEKLTWPEINDAVKQKKVVVVPIGSIEQHGPHLPLDVDMLEVTAVAQAAARLIPNDVLVLPTQVHGYTGHVMDFPGTINIHFETLIKFMIDIGKSLAYHGFKKIIYINGHGSNAPNMDLAARRVNVETDAEAIACNWWSMLSVDPEFMKGWRQSVIPGGCAHACELETSVYLYVDEENVKKDQIRNGYIEFHKDQSRFSWVDLFAAGVGTKVSWTASYSDTGVLGEAELATKEKGKRAVDEAAKQFSRLVKEFGARVKPPRGDHHDPLPTMPMPWGQEFQKPTAQGDVHDVYVKKGREKKG
ncbi:MAG TPA: creatininase family protein [Humisphaera sp.]|nr:creatininase family protein [Humisphaera sp.]